MFLLGLLTNVAGAQQWHQKTEIPVGGRWSAFCFSIGSKIYVGGGYAGNAQSLNDFWEYDTENDTWTPRANLPGAPNRTAGISFSWNGKGYIGLGSEYYNTFNAAFHNDLWEYDPATNQWAVKMSLPDSGRHEASVFVLGNKAYVVGGSTDYPYIATNDLWEFDLVNEIWTERADYPAQYIYSAMAFAHGGKGYIAGGHVKEQGVPGNGLATSDVFEYDPAADSWTQKADYCGPREGGVAFVLGDSAFVGTGTGKVGTTTYFYEEFCSYDFATDTWNPSASYPQIARAYAIAAVADDTAYVGGGWSYITGEDYYTDWYAFHSDAAITGLDALASSSIRVFPNPAQDRLYFTCGNEPCEAMTCVFYNMSGQVVAHGEISGEAPLDLAHLPQGIYVVELSGKETTGWRSRVLITD